MNLARVIPVLRIFDIAKAREFYVDYLGFRVDWEHRFGENFPLYLQISRSDCILHLSEHHGDATPGSRIIIHVTGIDDYHRELGGKQYRYMKPQIEDTPWESRDLSVTDPFGNRITFSEIAA